MLQLLWTSECLIHTGCSNLRVCLYTGGTKGMIHIFPDSVESFSKLGTHSQPVTAFWNVVCEIIMKNKENLFAIRLIFFKYLKIFFRKTYISECYNDN